jgi:D-3-phosphoglycerate dehydrogenase / 2-oxoglutarate reductase
LTADECAELGLNGTDLCVRLAPTIRDLAAQSDVLSLHLALTPETKQIVGPAVLARLKPGAILLNTARGELIDHAALAEAIRTRGLRVGLDVFEQEPDTATGAFHDPVAQLPGVYGTHHIGASTTQAQEAIAAETVRIVRAFKDTGRVPNVVNLARRTPATHMLVVRHHDRPGVLAHVFGHLRERSLNVQETENIVFEGALAAVARINLDKAPDAALLDSLRASPDVLDLQVVPL